MMAGFFPIAEPARWEHRDTAHYSPPMIRVFDEPGAEALDQRVNTFLAKTDIRPLAVSPGMAMTYSYGDDDPELMVYGFTATVIYQERLLPNGEGEA